MRRYLAPRQSLLAQTSVTPGPRIARRFDHVQSDGSHIQSDDRYSNVSYMQSDGTKAFTPVYDKDQPDTPLLHHIVTPRSKRQTRLRPLKNHEIFELSNLVLDLDSDLAKHVREFNTSDQEWLEEVWDLSEKRRAVKDQVRTFRTTINASRSAASELLNPTNPWRVTSLDLVSTAMQGWEISVPNENRSQDENTTASRQITRVTQSKRDHKPVRTRARLESELNTGNPQVGDNTYQLTNVREELRLKNGIPLHSTKDHLHLLQWMMVRREKIEYNNRVRRDRKPSLSNIASALLLQKGPTGIAGVRRLVFQSINAGVNLQKTNEVPRAIHDACDKILYEFPDNSLHYDALVFTNNLVHRLPFLSEPMKACILGLRLRCLAKLGLLDLTAAQLHHGPLADLTPDSGVNIVFDINAALQSWNTASREHKILKDAQQRQLLFRILTGVREDQGASVASIRALLSLDGPSSSANSSSQLVAYDEYLQLLARLGAARTIWAEWKTWRSLAPSTPSTREPSELGGKGAVKMHYIFSRATETLLSTLSSQPPHEKEESTDLDLDACQHRDHNWISHWVEVTEQQDSEDLEEKIKLNLFSWINGPLNNWMDTVGELSRATVGRSH